MTNYEYIRNMSIDEMATAIVNGISKNPCDYCGYNDSYCAGFPCWKKEDSEIVAEWLKRSKQ